MNLGSGIIGAEGYGDALEGLANRIEDADDEGLVASADGGALVIIVAGDLGGHAGEGGSGEDQIALIGQDGGGAGALRGEIAIVEADERTGSGGEQKTGVRPLVGGRDGSDVIHGADVAKFGSSNI